MYLFRDENNEVVAGLLNVREHIDLDDWEHRAFTYTLKVPDGTDMDTLREVLRDTLDQRCQHSYDCCGHWYRTVWTHTLRHAKRREWTVSVSYYKNV